MLRLPEGKTAPMDYISCYAIVYSQQTPITWHNELLLARQNNCGTKALHGRHSVPQGQTGQA